MKVLVTGAAGFIGSHLCEALVRCGDEVVAVDSFDDLYPRPYKESNWSEVTRSVGTLDFRTADVRDESFFRSLKGVPLDVIVHLAATAGVRPSIERPFDYVDQNLNGLLRVLEFARRRQIGVVFASSSSVYGNSTRVPFEESDVADRPVSPYAATKRAGEMLCHTYHHLYGIPVTCLRFFTVVGPRQRPEMALHKFVRMVHRGEAIPVFGAGLLSRDYTFIDDIVDGVIRSCRRLDGYRIYNLGNEHPHTTTQLIDLIEVAMQRKARRVAMPGQPGDVDVTCASVRKAESELGFSARTPLVTAVEEFVGWYQQVALVIESRLGGEG
jgi:UDP-glucuronate 4-epimerase